jgi:caspase domain-containing protein
MLRKTIIVMIFLMFINTNISDVCSIGLKKTLDDKPINLNQNEINDFDYWAIIIGTDCYASEYQLPSLFAKDTAAIYNTLLEDKTKWSKNNIKLLVDDNAKKQDIEDAFEWLASNANEDDIIFFYYSGHGNVVNDEEPIDEKDNLDEIIKPFDLECDDEGKPINDKYLTDDRLNELFHNVYINGVKGMFITFFSCLSGGLVNWSNYDELGTIKTIIGTYLKSNVFNDEISGDINLTNKVILASTIPRGTSRVCSNESKYMGTLGGGICKAIDNGKTSAEDISKYAKKWYIGRVIEDEKNLLYELGVPLWIIIHIIEKLSMFIGLGFISLSLPIWEDGYPVDNTAKEELIIVGNNIDNRSHFTYFPTRLFPF